MADIEKSFFDIDQLALDREWMDQPGLFFQYAKLLADAKRKLDESKSFLEVVKANMSRNVRDNPAAHQVTKITEGAITGAVTSSSVVQEAVKSVTENRHSVDVLTAAVTAMDHRKKALENLVYLHGQNYFSTPTEKNGSCAMSEKVNMAARKKVKEKKKKGRKK